MKKNIATLTVNPALDIYSTIDKMEHSKKMRCEAPSKDPGGGGVNVSRVIGRLGGDAKTIFTRGGYTGDIYTKLLENENITYDALDIKEELRQNVAIFENTTGELFRFGFPGAKLEEQEYKALLKKVNELEDVEFLVASGSLPPNVPSDFYAQVAETAKKKGIKLIVDTSGKALANVLEVGAYLLKPNIDELEDLTGNKAENREEQINILKEALEKFPVEVIILSLGADGAILATKEQIKHFKAPDVKALSSIGAGDSMVAGTVFSLSKGNSLEESVRYGLACGSATIKSPGTELLQKEDVDKLFEEISEH